ncbi:hypothetical protein AX14_008422, partial [Amanita brunnescens Koide BX004]
MDPNSGLPPGLTRPKSASNSNPIPVSSVSSASPLPPPSLPLRNILSPVPQRAAAASWASSLSAGLFPPSFPAFPIAPQMPQGILPSIEAVRPAGCLPHEYGPQSLHNNPNLVNLAVFPAPSPSDPWHIAHARVCAHATQPCAGCSAAFVCCSCRSLRFTPGIPSLAPPVTAPRRSRSSSPALFRNVGSGSPPPELNDDANVTPDDDAYARALAECDTCDNISCPRGHDEPATWTLTVEQFDEGTEEFFDRTFRACGACNRSCRRSFMGHKVKSRTFDNSTKVAVQTVVGAPPPPPAPRRSVPGSTVYANEHPVNSATPPETSMAPIPRTSPNMAHGNSPIKPDLPGNATLADPETPLASVLAPAPKAFDDNSLHQDLPALQNALRALNARPPTPAAFVATIRVKHDAFCTHVVTSCPTCSCGLVCCSCKRLFTPAVARHLACKRCQHAAHSCCQTAFCCKCGKPWLPSDSMLPPTASIAQRFRGG